MIEQAFLIWSIQHQSWWAPGARGYVEKIEEAGIYSLTDAMRICSGANFMIEPQSKGEVIPDEAMVPFSSRHRVPMVSSGVGEAFATMAEIMLNKENDNSI